MSADIPALEPQTFHAGDTVTWKRSIADYPADGGWTLKYALVKANVRIQIASTADGQDHLVAVSAAVSALYEAGEYQWNAFVENALATERFMIGAGALEIKQNYNAMAAGYDARSWVKITLDAIRARLSGDASTAQLNRRVGDMTVGEMPLKDLLDIEGDLSARYAKEQAANDLAAGRKRKTRLLTRFV